MRSWIVSSVNTASRILGQLTYLSGHIGQVDYNIFCHGELGTLHVAYN